MFMFDVDLARAAEAQRGYVTIADCERAGVAESARKRRLEAGVLLRRHEGVYRHAAHPPTFEGELLAATLAVNGVAAASGPSEMRLYGVRGAWSDVPEITVVGTALPTLEGVRVRRLDRIDPGDVHRRAGVPVLAPPLGLLLLGASAPPWKVETAVHDMVFQGFTTRARLIDALARYGGHGRRGTCAYRKAVSTLDADGRATQTNLELKLLSAMRDAGLPEPHLQFRVVDGDGRKRVLDFAWPDAMLDLETDGDRDHLSPAARAGDRKRDAALRAVGWGVLRVSSADVDLRLPATIAAIAASLSTSARRAG